MEICVSDDGVARLFSVTEENVFETVWVWVWWCGAYIIGLNCLIHICMETALTKSECMQELRLTNEHMVFFSLDAKDKEMKIQA